MTVALTEFSWATAVGRNANIEKGDAAWSLPNSITTEGGQGLLASQALSTLTSNRSRWRLSSIQWYTWSSKDPPRSSNVFDYAGLSAIVIDPSGMRRKPGLATFRSKALSLQGCRAKVIATSCSR